MEIGLVVTCTYMNHIYDTANSILCLTKQKGAQPFLNVNFGDKRFGTQYQSNNDSN